MSEVHGRGKTTPVHQYSAAKPDGADQQPAECSEREWSSYEEDGCGFDAQRLDDVERDGCPQLTDDQWSDDEADAAADQHVERDSADGAARADPTAGSHERQAGRSGNEQGLQDQPKLGHTEVELGLEDGQADQHPAHGGGPLSVRPPVTLGGDLPRGERAFLVEKRHAHQGQARSSDQHQVSRTPQGHVLAEDAMPHVIEGEAEQRVRAGAHEEQTSDGGSPGLRELYAAWAA